MHNTQERTTPLWWNRPTVYWHVNQLAITFHSSLHRSKDITDIIAALKLDDLNAFLSMNGFQLKSFTSKDVPHPQDTPNDEIERLEDELEMLENELEALERAGQPFPSSDRSPLAGEQVYKTPRQRDIEELEARIEAVKRDIEKRERANGDAQQQNGNSSDEQAQDQTPKQQNMASALNSPTGKYLFRSPSGHGSMVICFFHVQSATMPAGSDVTRTIVTLINRNIDKLQLEGNIPIIAAMPNWIGGGTGGPITQDRIGHGCPVTPPIPLTGVSSCASHPGTWPIELPELSATMQGMTGKGVTVFVLDTIPTVEKIRRASQSAGDNNLLLKDIAAGLETGAFIVNHQRMPRRIETGIQTGNDVFGRLFGFNMPDHGLFVAGIIHDLAREAKIECIRVLNDSGIGDFAVICQALNTIQARMETEKLDQVVINLSLIISSADERLASHWFSNDGCFPAADFSSMLNEVKLLYTGLHLMIQSLTAHGAVVVASAGNGSHADARSSSMDMSMGMPTRFGPSYPAAIPEVISVGAVYNNGGAASYSNFPALPPNHNGIATHGGGFPIPVPPAVLPPAAPPPPPGAKTWAIVTDAVIGVYSSPTYSMLSADDLPPTNYLAPADSNAWAYWSGTSFATPVISAVAARILQGLTSQAISSNKSVQDIITTASGQQTILADNTTLNTNTAFGPSVRVLKAVQVCQPTGFEVHS